MPNARRRNGSSVLARVLTSGSLLRRVSNGPVGGSGSSLFSLKKSVPPRMSVGRIPLIVRCFRMDDFTPVESFIWKALNVLVELASYYGLKLDAWDSRRIRLNALSHWMQLLPEETEKNAIALCKYKAAAFFSHHKGLELPPWPFSPTHPAFPTNHSLEASVLLGGKFRRWQSLLSFLTPDKFSSFVASVSIGWKKGCPRPDEEVVDLGVRSTFKILTTPPAAPRWADAKENFLDLDAKDLTDEVVRTVEELFKGVSFPRPWGEVKPFFPSTSANYINTRSELGAVGYLLRDNKGLLPTYNLSAVSRRSRLDDTSGELKENVILDQGPGQAVFNRFLRTLRTQATNEPPNVKLVGLSEAFKVRVISKGPPITSTYLKFVQRWLWQTLRKHQSFRLIGEPVNEMIIQDRIGALHQGEKYASVDYSAATDLLFSEYSDLVVRTIARVCDMDQESADLFARLLTEHMIEDPDSGSLTRQRRGQLMGSIVSFPILCILNAVVCRIALEVSRNGTYLPYCLRGSGRYKSLALATCPLLINGDDALMRLTDTGYKAWLVASKVAGFSPSIGKTFFTSDFCQINSLNFDVVSPYQVKGRTCRFRAVPFVNMGLLYGKVRSSSGKGKGQTAPLADRTGTIGSRMRDLLKRAPESCRDRLAAAFVSRNLPILRKAKVPWFLPEILGGLGLSGIPSEDDYVYACWAVRNLGTFPRSQRPVQLSEPAAWQVRSLCQDFLRRMKIPERQLTPSEDELSQKAQTWVGLMQIFDPAVQADPELIYKSTSSEGALSLALRRNERFIGRWKRHALSLVENGVTSFKPFSGFDPESGELVILGRDRVNEVVENLSFSPVDFALSLREDTDLFSPDFWGEGISATFRKDRKDNGSLQPHFEVSKARTRQRGSMDDLIALLNARRPKLSLGESFDSRVRAAKSSSEEKEGGID